APLPADFRMRPLLTKSRMPFVRVRDTSFCISKTAPSRLLNVPPLFTTRRPAPVHEKVDELLYVPPPRTLSSSPSADTPPRKLSTPPPKPRRPPVQVSRPLIFFIASPLKSPPEI